MGLAFRDNGKLPDLRPSLLVVIDFFPALQAGLGKPMDLRPDADGKDTRPANRLGFIGRSSFRNHPYLAAVY